ncbi:group XIIA secretory phospholipase A2-like [Clytia hemisphaerica]|uniref:Phospholipase A2 n=1 Tax=Clytia hemisphaerica TaxID=252671 RepID=A0A7M5X0H5_9CNID
MAVKNFSCTVVFFIFLTIISSYFTVNGNEINLGNLAEIFSTLAGGEGCVFRCPKGSPKRNPGHKPTSNGCGSYGVKFDTSQYPGFEGCCNTHDECYDTCNNEREDCDKQFQECLKDSCLFHTVKGGVEKKLSRKKLKDCEGIADVMYAGTLGLGCGSYLEAQRNACLCDGKTLSKKQMQKIQQNEL